METKNNQSIALTIEIAVMSKELEAVTNQPLVPTSKSKPQTKAEKEQRLAAKAEETLRLAETKYVGHLLYWLKLTGGSKHYRIRRTSALATPRGKEWGKPQLMILLTLLRCSSRNFR
jgi:hypothetical protein